MNKARILFWDIEATDLEASFGYTLCVGYKYLGQKTTHVISLADFPRVADPKKEPDIHLMRAIHRILAQEADIIVGWYSKPYDRPFVNTRMMLAGLDPLPPLNAEHIDLYWTARSNLKLHSNRLQAVSETLGCPYSKTPVRADIWRRAQRGDAAALAYVHHHCKLDVQILEWTYMQLRPFVRQHPPVTNNKEACRVCGEMTWESNGKRFTAGNFVRRLRCRTCGAWAFVKADDRRAA